MAAMPTLPKLGNAQAQTVFEFDPHRVRPFADQPRKRFRNIEGLARSIKIVGQTTPGLVKPVCNDPRYDAELIDGERRLRACLLVGVPFRAIVISDVKGSEDQFAISVAANFGREGHDVIEVAEAARRFQEAGRSLQEISDTFGKSVGWVSQHLALLKLHPIVRALLIPPDDEETGSVESSQESGAALTVTSSPRSKRKRGKLTFSLALLIAPLPTRLQIEAAQHITDESLSLMRARRYILRLAAKTGHQAGKRTQSLSERFSSLTTLVERTRDAIGIYLDMSASDCNQMLMGAHQGMRQDLGVTLRSLINDLQQLASVVETPDNKRKPQSADT